MKSVSFTVTAALLSSSLASAALAAGPSKIHCQIATTSTRESIEAVMRSSEGECQDYGCDTFSRLLQYSEPSEFPVRDAIFPCDQATGICRADIDNQQLRLSYSFNGQGGIMSLEDKVSGQVAENSWRTHPGQSNTGYLNMDLGLRNYRGGLLGATRLYEVRASCYAKLADF